MRLAVQNRVVAFSFSSQYVTAREHAPPYIQKQRNENQNFSKIHVTKIT